MVTCAVVLCLRIGSAHLQKGLAVHWRKEGMAHIEDMPRLPL